MKPICIDEQNKIITMIMHKWPTLFDSVQKSVQCHLRDNIVNILTNNYRYYACNHCTFHTLYTVAYTCLLRRVYLNITGNVIKQNYTVIHCFVFSLFLFNHFNLETLFSSQKLLQVYKIIMPS